MSIEYNPADTSLSRFLGRIGCWLGMHRDADAYIFDARLYGFPDKRLEFTWCLRCGRPRILDSI